MARIIVLFACIPLMMIYTFACCNDPNRVTSPDNTQPSWILATSPRNGVSNVHTETDIWAVFSPEIEPASVNTSTFYLNNHAVPCSVRCDGLMARLYPLSPLEPDTQYTATLTNGIMDTSGNRMQTSYEWSFSTRSDTLWDTVAVHSEFNLSISQNTDVYQGHYTYVTISALNDSSEVSIGGFDLLIAYDAGGLTFMGAELGEYVDSCWEYFTYRYGHDGNCEGDCPSGLVRLFGIADVSNGGQHPSSSCTSISNGTRAELVKMKFYVTNDRTYDCMYLPIRFFWDDCEDNILTSRYNDTLWASKEVYDFNWDQGLDEITGDDFYGGHWWLGDCQDPDPERTKFIPSIIFTNGGVDIICTDSITTTAARGDLNMNNIANEIADAILYTHYFIYGLGVFDINIEKQIAQSDVNNDDWTLTVADFTYMIRIIVGDALPSTHLEPFADTVTVSYTDSLVWSQSDTDIGSMLFVFDGPGEATLLAPDIMNIKSDVVDGMLRVLVWSDNTIHIPPGTHKIVRIDGDVSLYEIHASDYNGNMMVTLLGQ